MIEPNYKELYKRADGMIRLLSDEIDDRYNDFYQKQCSKEQLYKGIDASVRGFLYDYFMESED